VHRDATDTQPCFGSAVAAILWATETASGRSRKYQAGAVALSLITAGRKAAGVLDTSRRACRQLAPERRYIT
jgi:hypothetical protein